MPILRLSESTINLIAAGEVVERPASVVKELVENSIDSGAKSIEIYLEQAGKNLIVVTDNGCGMSPEDITLAIQRHTTSKLNELNIADIKFFGFRGEALPAIASVSKMSITSRTDSSETAYQIQVIDNKVTKFSEIAHNQGTKIKVQDLFGHVPARLKFLKTDQRELAFCLETVKKLALANPHIAFVLRHETNVLLKLPENNIKERVEGVLGKSFSDSCLDVNFHDEHIKVYGYIAIPTYHKASSEQQFTFINNRPVKDKLISACIKVAYQDYIVQGRFAPLVLFVEVPYEFVDVNVHPAKNEVRFQEASLVRRALIMSIKNAIDKTIGSRSMSIQNHSALQDQDSLNQSTIEHNYNLKSPLSDFKGQTPFHDYSIQRQNISDNQTKQLQLNAISSNRSNYNFSPSYNSSPSPTQAYNENLFSQAINQANTELNQTLSSSAESPEYFLGVACGQIHNNYIFAQNTSGMILVDQHAAHERIVYEKLKQQIKEQSLQGQELLLPIIVELDSDKKVQFLIDQKEYFSSLAMKFEAAGKNSVLILEVPQILASSNIIDLVRDIADEIYENEQEFSATRIIEHVTETYACHHSIRSGQKLSINQMNELLRQMETTPGASQCCHGRPTYAFISLQDLEKLFKRR